MINKYKIKKEDLKCKLQELYQEKISVARRNKEMSIIYLLRSKLIYILDILYAHDSDGNIQNIFNVDEYVQNILESFIFLNFNNSAFNFIDNQYNRQKRTQQHKLPQKAVTS